MAKAWRVVVVVGSFAAVFGEYVLPYQTSQTSRQLLIETDSLDSSKLEWIAAPTSETFSSLKADELSWRKFDESKYIDIPIIVWRYPISSRIARRFEYSSVAFKLLGYDDQQNSLILEVPKDPIAGSIHLTLAPTGKLEGTLKPKKVNSL